jgi:TfoX/Sxy family transcriptional regulator of competence genes
MESIKNEIDVFESKEMYAWISRNKHYLKNTLEALAAKNRSKETESELLTFQSPFRSYKKICNAWNSESYWRNNQRNRQWNRPDQCPQAGAR